MLDIIILLVTILVLGHPEQYFVNFVAVLLMPHLSFKLGFRHCLAIIEEQHRAPYNRRYDTQHNNSQHNDNQHKWLVCNTQHK